MAISAEILLVMILVVQQEHPGCALPLFEPAAIEALFQATHGLPRKINRVAHYALSAAALAKLRQTSIEHVQAAIEEVQ